MPSRHEPAARPPYFRYHRNRLYCENVPALTLTERFGTPLYVYSRSAICDRYAALQQAFAAVPHTICYSVKASPNLSLLRTLAGLGAGFDIVSDGELERVRRASPGEKNIVFSGVGKTAKEIDAALRAGILLFNVESESELRLLSTRAAQAKKIAPVALRVNPDVAARTHPYITTGLREHKFGVPMSSALPLYRLAQQLPGLIVMGVSTHIGSQIREVQPFAQAVERMTALVHQLRQQGIAIRYMDMGGGLGIDYTPKGESSFRSSITEYARAVISRTRKLGIHLLLEPGRMIIGPAGVLLTQVIYRKRNGKKRFVIVDAGMNDLLRPALYQAQHQIIPAQAPASTTKETVDIVGPVCETGDFLARDRRFPVVAEGDLLAVLDAGAYGMSLASNYNSRPRPAEVMVDGSKSQLIRRREKIRDLIGLES